MLSLETHLDSAPKSVLAPMRRHWNLAPGSVVSNAAVAQAVRERAFDADRIQALLERCTPAQRDVLWAVYGSGDRGLPVESLRAAFPSAERHLLDDTVEEFRRELVVARTGGGNPVLHGFSELWPDLADRFADSVPAAEKGSLAEIGYEAFAVQHLLHLFAALAKAPWKCTREGAVKQSDRREYDKSFRFGKQISPRLFTEVVDGKISPAMGEELALLLELSRRLGFVARDEEGIRLRARAEAAARKNCRELWTALLDAWTAARGFSAEGLRTLLRTLSTPRRARPWCKIWSLRERLDADRKLRWSGLPAQLRELVVLGMVRLGTDASGSVELLGLTQCASVWCETGSLPAELAEAMPGYATANFEVFVPITSCGEHAWTLHRAAELAADEQFLKFTLTEERLLEALRGGVDPHDVRSLAEWLKLPRGPAKTLEEWLKSFERCRLLRPLLLEVRDDALRGKLMASRALSEWISCEIDGFGLVLRDGAESAVLPILESYGLHPRLPSEEGAPLPDEPAPESAPAAKPAPEIDWSWSDPPPETALRFGEIDLSGNGFGEKTPDQRRRLLRHCAVNRLEATLWWRDQEGKPPKKIRVVLEDCDGDTVSGSDEKGRPVRVEIAKIANLRF